MTVELTALLIVSGVLFVSGIVIGWVARKPEVDELRADRDNLALLLDRASKQL